MINANLGICAKLAKSLSNAEYAYDSDFRYNNHGTIVIIESWDDEDGDWSESIPAFTMCELWDMLPRINGWNVEIEKCTDYSLACYPDDRIDTRLIEKRDKNPCDALAHLVLWCIENNHSLNLKKNKKK